MALFLPNVEIQLSHLRSDFLFGCLVVLLAEKSFLEVFLHTQKSTGHIIWFILGRNLSSLLLFFQRVAKSLFFYLNLLDFSCLCSDYIVKN